MNSESMSLDLLGSLPRVGKFEEDIEETIWDPRAQRMLETQFETLQWARETERNH